MTFDPRLFGVGGLSCCVWLAAAPIAVVVAQAANPPARINLLAAGERASVVVELADEWPKATAIEATDNQSFDVEIGPVRSLVANQLLQAAKQSPLVSEVRVRSVPQGAEGTLITLHVTAKLPVSGLVRRSQRRVYIDLEPLSIVAASKQAARTVAAAPTETPISSAPSPASAAPSPASVAPVPPSSSSPALETADALRRAEALARQSDVKSLEKLKSDLIVRQPSPASGSAAPTNAANPVVEQIDQYLDEARKKRLLADAKLFKEAQPDVAATSPAPAAPAQAPTPERAFPQALAALLPELEKANAMLSQWQPGFVPAASLPQSLEALTIRLRALHPPARLSASHERLCAALGALAKSWVSGPDGVTLIPVGPSGSDGRLIMSTKAALYDYLQDIAREGLTALNSPATVRS